MNQAHRNERLPHIVALICACLLPGLALAATPQLQVFTVPDEGEGPLEVKIVVRAQNADARAS